MRVAVIRVAGTEFDPAKYARQYGFAPDVIWHLGEPDHSGRVRSDSGFNLTISDADSTRELIKQVRGWIEENKSALVALGGLGAAAAIDVGLTVGTPAQFTASVRLTPSDLALLRKWALSCRSAPTLRRDV